MHHLVPLVKPHKIQNSVSAAAKPATVPNAIVETPVWETTDNPAYIRTQTNLMKTGESPKKREVQEDLQVYKMENGTRSKYTTQFLNLFFILSALVITPALIQWSKSSKKTV